jgi:hypothetical protein
MSALFAFVIAMGIGSAARGDDAKCQDAVAKGSRNVGNQEQKNDRSLREERQWRHRCVHRCRGRQGGCEAHQAHRLVRDGR